MLRLLALAALLAGADSQTFNKSQPKVEWDETTISGVTVYTCEVQEVTDGKAAAPASDAFPAPGASKRWILALDPAARDSDVNQVAAQARAAGCTDVQVGHPSEGGLAIVTVHATEDMLKDALAEMSASVRYVEQDSPVEVLTQLDPPSWGLDRIDQRRGLDASYTGSGSCGGQGVHVYVLDTGIRTTHEDFEGRAIPTLESWTGNVVECNPSDTSCAFDIHGHGTHCAGTVGGRDHGVAKASTLHAVKVLGDEGGGSWVGVALAMDWVATSGEKPAVVSMSLGGYGRIKVFEDMVDALVSSNIPVVVAAGNDADDACRYTPAYVPKAITVGSTDHLDMRSEFSNHGSCVDLFAPGSDITSPCADSDVAVCTWSGTSMACPHVAGAAALLLGGNPSATAADVLDGLLDLATEDKISDAGPQSPNLLLFVDAAPALEPTESMPCSAALAAEAGRRDAMQGLFDKAAPQRGGGPPDVGGVASAIWGARTTLVASSIAASGGLLAALSWRSWRSWSQRYQPAELSVGGVSSADSMLPPEDDEAHA